MFGSCISLYVLCYRAHKFTTVDFMVIIIMIEICLCCVLCLALSVSYRTAHVLDGSCLCESVHKWAQPVFCISLDLCCVTEPVNWTTVDVMRIFMVFWGGVVCVCVHVNVCVCA